MLDWLSLLLSEAPGEPSIRRVLCAIVTLTCCALCFWPGLTPLGKDLAAVALVTAFGAVTAGRFAEAMDRRTSGGEPPVDKSGVRPAAPGVRKEGE